MKKFYLFVILFFGWQTIFAQAIKGIVLITNTVEPVAKATVTIGKTFVVSNEEGLFVFSNMPIGTYTLQISAKGFKQTKEVVTLSAEGEEKNVTLYLTANSKEISTVTVSGSRFKKRAAEEVVSIEVLKPDFIKNAAITRVDDALNKMPGVTVIDNQINIRGGAGWSYGAGSRVMVLVDDMPMLTADAQDAKWDFLPIENAEQIEILKGAASSLYGSSALNGVVHFRTAYAKKQPITKLQLFGGMFGSPNRKAMQWWSNAFTPSFGGGYASHSRKIGNTNLVLGSAWYKEQSYLQGDNTNRIRFNANVRHAVKSVAGLSVGFNTNVQIGTSGTFLLHKADTSLAGLLHPYGGLVDSTTTLSKNKSVRLNIDPSITYNSKNGWQHALRTRYFLTKNIIPLNNRTSTANSYYAEYQAIKKWNDTTGFFANFNCITGLMATYNTISGALYGKHNSTNYAPYLQLEKKIGKVWFVGGARYESFLVDTYKVERRPVFRAGVNYQPAIATNIRASFGQGYRYPTIAERFIYNNFGAASVFPNPKLKSESGYSAEVGIKQGFAKSKWRGYADVAAYLMRYNEMMEFNFGLQLPDSPVANVLDYIGFKSKNIGNTHLAGIDASVFAQYNGNKVQHSVMFGYNYLNPTQVDIDSAILSNYSTNKNFLKYRMAHTIKASWDVLYKKWTIASINTINSAMVNIDEVFENSKPTNDYGKLFDYATSPTSTIGNGLASTIKKHRDLYNKWVFLADVRISYQINKTLRVAGVIKNLTNVEYYVRPSLIGPTRNFTLQIFADL